MSDFGALVICICICICICLCCGSHRGGLGGEHGGGMSLGEGHRTQLLANPAHGGGGLHGGGGYV